MARTAVFHDSGTFDDGEGTLTFGTPDAADVPVDSTTLVGTATDVQGALEELDNGIADHLADTTDAHAGTAITNTPAGGIAATTVQAAINELDTEKQPVDSDLTAIAALSPTNDDVVQRKAGAWTNRTMAQLIADLAALGTTFQPLDSDLTAVAALSTTSFGRSILTLADAAALLAAAGGAAASHTHAESDVTNLTTDLAAKVPKSLYDANTILKADSDDTPTALTMGASTILARLAAGGIVAATPAELRTLLGLVVGTNVQAWDADLDTIAGLTPTTDNFMVAASSAWASRTPAQAKTSLSLVKGDVGLGNVDNTSDASKPVSTAQQTALDLKANLASPALTGSPTVPTQTAGDNSTKAASTAYVRAGSGLAIYHTLLQASGSHIAGKVAGTYGLGVGDPLAVSGTGTLYPLAVIYIASADYPNADGLSAKLRIRAQLAVNDVAPTGNFTLGLYPITRPGTSGGTGLNIYTIGTVVSGSNGASFTTPAADSHGQAVGADFALPADGLYIIACVTTQTVATNSLVHINAQLQMHHA